MNIEARNPRLAPGRTLRSTIIVTLITLAVLVSAMFLGAYMQNRSWLRHQKPAIDATGQFIMLVGSGQVGPAKGLCGEAITEQGLTDTAEEFQAWGAIRDVNKYYGGKVHSADDVEVQATINFDTGTRLFTGHWSVREGIARLERYSFTAVTPNATTMPFK
ncbi:MAG: hypothetical protein H7144_03055 [Burkholderiales bacterium]|nr:hypothetical protein [Phycisphaerae bacterium]